ncbi:unnamed protein product, partial [Brassica rapa subsp. trilocularis]
MPRANCASFKNHAGDLSSKDTHTPGANDGTFELADAVKTTSSTSPLKSITNHFDNPQ